MHAVIPNIPNESRTGFDDDRGRKGLVSVAGRAEWYSSKKCSLPEYII
jgi:hypothetical protein